MRAKVLTLIWKRSPKEVYTGRRTVSTGVALAVSHFNDGASSNVQILKKLGVPDGPHTNKWSVLEDEQRVKESQKRNEKVQKKD